MDAARSLERAAGPGVEPAPRGRPGTREALLNAVDELTAERGWHGCSLQAVARRAGLTTGAVYSTFGSRGALLAAAMLRRITDLAVLREDEPDLARAVAAYARDYYAMGRAEGAAALMIAQADLLRLSTTDPAVHDALRDSYAGLFARLTADIAARAGRRRLVAPPAELTHRLVGVLQGLTLQQTVLDVDLGEDAFVSAALNVTGLAAAAR